MSAQPHDRAPGVEPASVPHAFFALHPHADRSTCGPAYSTILHQERRRALPRPRSPEGAYRRLKLALARRVRRPHLPLPPRIPAHIVEKGLLGILALALIGGVPELTLRVRHTRASVQAAVAVAENEGRLDVAQPVVMASATAKPRLEVVADPARQLRDEVAALSPATYASAGKEQPSNPEADGSDMIAEPAAPIATLPREATVQPAPDAAAAIKDDSTNLRAGPGTGYNKLAQLRKGDVVKIEQRYAGWFKVTTSAGLAGWLDGDLLSMNDGAADQAPVTADVPALPTATTVPTPPPQSDPDATATPAPQVAFAAKSTTAQKWKPAATPTPKPASTPQPTLTPRPSNRWVWPTGGEITSGFGYRDFSVGQFHNGLDIANGKGTPLRAARSGIVVQAGWCSGYGYCVIIDHGDGFRTEYGHMAWDPPVNAGDQVDAGDLIGYMGSTYDLAGGGYSTGVHLHFTIKLNGRAVNPLRYLP